MGIEKKHAATTMTTGAPRNLPMSAIAAFTCAYLPRDERVRGEDSRGYCVRQPALSLVTRGIECGGAAGGVPRWPSNVRRRCSMSLRSACVPLRYDVSAQDGADKPERRNPEQLGAAG